MALSIAKTRSTTGDNTDSDLRHLRKQFNLLCDELRARFVIYDADAGITDTTAVAGLDAAVSKIGDLSGTAFS